MRSCAYCTADAYSIKVLYEALRAQRPATLYRDAIHVIYTRNEEDSAGHAFFFNFGAVVFWGLEEIEELTLLEEIQPYQKKPYPHAIQESYLYTYGDKATIVDDALTLPNQEDLTKLAFSHGMAQSVKLEHFENLIEKASLQLGHLPEDLAKRGKIFLSRREIRREMGNLFLTRHAISLHLDVLDLPDFFWDYPDLEPYYTLIAGDLNIQDRVEVLNRRLDNVHELYEMLGNELNHQHSSRLELIIIGLILVEVILFSLHDILGWI